MSNASSCRVFWLCEGASVHCGSGTCGINWWVNDSDLVNGTHDPANKWRWIGQKNPGAIPVLQDCGFMLVRAEPLDPAPQMDGEFLWTYGGGMRRACTNRHHGGVNMLFMDWSMNKVGLKKLWTLKWHRTFNTAGPWTATGGVGEDDWPRWMKNL